MLELISKFIKVIYYKINTYKSVVFIYTNNEQCKWEIKKIITFTIVSKVIK